MKPIIGITADWDDGSRFKKDYAGRKIVHLWQQYVDAIRDAGGCAVILSPTEDNEEIRAMVKLIDGLLISGGAFDIPPRDYGEKTLKAAKVSPKPLRSAFEVKLFRAALKKGLPVLGICGGEQVINVALGGRLFQDLKLQRKNSIRHSSGPGGKKTFHGIGVAPKSLLAKVLFGKTAKGRFCIRVNSSHHQAVKSVGAGLKTSATARDLVIEAIEMDKGFVLGVQWHPERLYKTSPEQANLLKAFVAAARNNVSNLKL
jgi:putative glutamine amidotransferase